MEEIFKSVASLRALSDVPQAQFNPRSDVVVTRLRDLYNNLIRLPVAEQDISVEIANYVHAPIYSLLQKDKLGDVQTEYVLLILAFLFDHPWHYDLSIQKARQYLSVCVYIVAPITPGVAPDEAFKASSSEVRTAGFKCLASILNAMVACNLNSKVEPPQINGLIVFVLQELKYGLSDSDLNAALKCLYILLTQVVPNIQAILPNTASTLGNFITGAYGYHHTDPRVLAIECFEKLLVAGLSEVSEWAKAASVQVEKILLRLLKVFNDSNTKAQRAILELAKSLATHCWEALELCQETILEFLVRTDTTSFLQRPKFKQAFDSKMVSYMDLLPMTLTAHDPSEAVVQLTALQRYVSKASNQLFLDTLMRRIQESLPPLAQASKTYQGDLPDSKVILDLIAEPALQTDIISLESLKVGSRTDPKTEKALVSLLRTIGGTECGQNLAYSLLEQLESEYGLASVQTFWLASCIVSGSGSVDVAQDYLSYAFKVVEKSASFYQPHQTPSIVALAVFTVGELALKEEINFQQHLVDGLFPVVDLLGSGHTLIIKEAKNALAKIAKGCDYESVQDLVLSNKDYVLDGISSKLNTLDISPSTLTMLGVLIKLAGNDIVVFLDDIIESLFIILDKYHGYSVLVTCIFAVFSAVIDVMARPTTLSIKPPPRKPGPITTLEQLKEELQRKPILDADLTEPVKQPELDEENLEVPNSDESEPDDFEPPVDTTEEWNSPIEKGVYMIAKRIFDKCTVFLTHKSPSLQANLLRLVGQCVSILATNNKEFLPEINAIWPVISTRVLDETIFVSEAALSAVARLCQGGQDFMSSRIEALWKVIEKKNSVNFYARPWPEYSPENRWINALCKCLTSVLDHTPVDFETFDSILWTLKPTLKHNSSLQQALEKINADDVWLSLDLK